MSNICTIYRRETASYFNSPIAYIFIVSFVAFLALFFFVLGNFFGQTNPDVVGYFAVMPWVFAVFVPAVTMRLWAEEKRAGTIELLMTMPLRTWQVVVGKYLAGLTVIFFSLFFTLIVPLTVSLVVNQVDWGVVFSSYVGALLMASVYIALGAWTSTFTQNQIVALLVAVFLSFLLAVVGTPTVINPLNGFIDGAGSFLGWFGTFYHFQSFARGMLSLLSVIYAVSVTAFFLTLTNVFVEGRKF